MKKVFIFSVSLLLLAGVVMAQECNSTNLDQCLDETNCTDSGGYWYDDQCNEESEATCDSDNLDLCSDETNCTDSGGYWYDDQCNEEAEEENGAGNGEGPGNKVCCHRFGYGADMEIVNSKYQMIDEEDCVVPDDFVGGGREIVDENMCQHRERERIRAGMPIEECPEDCTCTGSTVKCPINNGGREMTVYAGRSGNMIVKIKGVNMSTNVELYKQNKSLYGIFKGNKTREIKVFPDQVREKLEAKLQARLEGQEIELDENGYYQVQTKKRARLFLLIPVRERIRAEVHSETGEVIRVRNPWWGFLARDVRG